MIAMTVGVIIIGSAVTLIGVTLRLSSQNKFLQAALFLRQDLLDKVTVFAEHQWYCPVGCVVEGTVNPAKYGIYNLNKGSGNDYRFKPNITPFEWQQAEEIVTLDDVQYTRYFYAENVCRDSFGAIVGPAAGICSSGVEDPSTQFVTVVVSWQQAGSGQELRGSKYLTRSRNLVTVQTDWSGGVSAGAVVDALSDTNQFDSSLNIEVNQKGSIKIQ